MAHSVTKYAEIQQDEIEALRSIYMEDFVENETRTGAWNVGEPSLSNILILCQAPSPFCVCTKPSIPKSKIRL